MSTMIMMSTGNIQPVHGVHDVAKLEQLIESMETTGWQGRPILAIGTEEYAQALTGSHRIEAAHRAGIDIPVLLIECDTDWTAEYRIDNECDRLDLVADLGDDDARTLLGNEDGEL